MKKQWSICIVFMFLFTHWAMAQAAPNEKLFHLRYQMKKGQTFHLHNMHISSGFIKRGNNPKVNSFRKSDLKLAYQVQGVNQDKMLFEVEFTGKKTTLSNEAGEPVDVDFTLLKGKKVSYEMSPTGQISAFKGMESLPIVPGPGGFTFGPEFYQSELEHMLPVLPAEGVKPGSQWIHEDFGVTIEYTLMDELDYCGYPCVRIYARILDDPRPQKRKNAQGKDITISRYEPFTDIYYFAYEQGMLLSRISVCSNGKVEVKEEQDTPILQREGDVLYETHITFGNQN